MTPMDAVRLYILPMDAVFGTVDAVFGSSCLATVPVVGHLPYLTCQS